MKPIDFTFQRFLQFEQNLHYSNVLFSNYLYSQHKHMSFTTTEKIKFNLKFDNEYICIIYIIYIYYIGTKLKILKKLESNEIIIELIHV